MQFWSLTTYLKQLKWVFSVFILEPAIFKVTVPAEGGNRLSRVLGIKQRKEKGTEKVAALQRVLKCFVSFLVQSTVKKELYSKHLTYVFLKKWMQFWISQEILFNFSPPGIPSDKLQYKGALPLVNQLLQLQS